MVQVRFWPFVAENILEVIGAKRTAIFPLRVADAISFTNGNPTMPANGLPLSVIGLFKPRNDQWRFRLELPVSHIVVGQCAVKWILFGNERDRDVIAAV